MMKIYYIGLALILYQITLFSSDSKVLIEAGARTSIIPISPKRKPQGFRVSPYALKNLPRYFINALTNGLFSYINPDKDTMNLLSKKGMLSLATRDIKPFNPTKIMFLGDIMVSKSGNPPQMNTALTDLIKSADVIIANIEAPVIEDQQEKTKRDLSLQFKMPVSYLKAIYNINPKALWLFSIANNHAFDTSDKDSQDITGLQNSMRIIIREMPNSSILGTQNVAVLKINGLRVGVIGWTDIMNNDSKHIKKPITRAEDISPLLIQKIKNMQKLDILIGFVHGNEEQSYYPLKETRDRWNTLLGTDKFDFIVGTGPHVIQPAEQIKSSLIFHSIGNFFSAGGRSQTKVGLIPEIDLKYNSLHKKIALSYIVHFIQQKNDTLLLFDVDENKIFYPEIVDRLKKIWSTLF